MEIFSKDILEVRGLRSRGFQLLLHELQQRCVWNFEKKCNYYLLDNARNSILKDENVVNLLLRLDCKESVSRRQNKTLYNSIFIYDLSGIEKLQSAN